MSRPINPDSTHRRVLAALREPKSSNAVANELHLNRKEVTRAIAHLQVRGLVRIVVRRPQFTYAATNYTPPTFLCPLAAMQQAARTHRQFQGASA